MLLIGFGHRARQGKNAAAMAMLDTLPLDARAHMYAFADALKKEVDVAAARLGGPAGVIEMFQTAGLMPAWVKPEPQGKQRSLLQWWGTDYRRAEDPGYWVHKLGEKIANDAPDVAFVTDVRFPNEVEAIRKWGGVVVRVTRTTAPDFAVPAEHESESVLDGFAFDYDLEAADLPELKTKAAELFREIGAKFGLPQHNAG